MIKLMAPLRSLDWRFLMPMPEDRPFTRLLLLGGDDHLAEAIRVLGVAQEVVRQAGDRPVEAVVRLHDARASLDEALGHVPIGGVLYAELDRWFLPSRLSTSPSAFRHRLAQAGAELNGLYWVRPDFGRRRLYVPLDTEVPIRWYFDTLYAPTTGGQATLAAALRLATGLRGARLTRVARCLALTAVRGASVRAFWEDAPSDDGRPWEERSVRPLVIMGGEGDWSRVTALPFREGSLEPTLVLKLPREPFLNEWIEHEQAVLDAIHARASVSMRSSLPHPLGCRDWYDLRLAAESYAPGRSLFAACTHWRRSPQEAIEGLSQAITWLTELHASAAIRPARWADAQLEDAFTGTVAAYGAAFGTTEDERRLFAIAQRRRRKLRAGSLPVVWQHCDLGPWNIFLGRERPSVVDWEVARNGPALADLIYLLLHWYLSVGRYERETDRQRALWRLFGEVEPADPFVKAARDARDRYLVALGIDPGGVPAMVVHVLAEQAVDRYRRLEAVGSQQGRSRDDNRYVGYVETLAKRAAALFTGADGA